MFLVLVTFSIFACGLVIFITLTRLTSGNVTRTAFPRVPAIQPCKYKYKHTDSGNNSRGHLD